MRTASLLLALGVMALPAVIIGCRPAQPPAQLPTAEQPTAGQPTAGQPTAERSATEGPYPGQPGSPPPDPELAMGTQPAPEPQEPPPPPALPAPGLATGPGAAPAAPAAPAAKACGAARAGSPVTRDAYKHDVACRIHARNGTRLYEGAPPPVLRSVVVLSLRIDAKGRPVRIGVLRSNGIRELERRAMQSVRDAAPFPAPGAGVLRQGVADITETWLFRDDGRFQVRSLAMVQAHSGY